MQSKLSLSFAKFFGFFWAFIFFTNITKAQTSVPITHSVYFKSDQYDLEPRAKCSLDSFITQLKNSINYTVWLEANTDADGSDGYNITLSKNRAKATEQYLSKNGITISKIKAIANGETKPIFTNNSDEGKAGNRRVDLKSNITIYNSTKDIFETVINSKTQKFNIKSDKDQTIKGKDGCTVHIPAGSLVYEDGSSVTGNIEIQIQEAIKPEDIFMMGLTTQSQGKILQTGGMINIEAIANGKKLKVADGKNLNINIPTNNVDKNMQLFTGNKKDDGSIDWVPTGQAPQGVAIEIDISQLPKIAFNTYSMKPLEKFENYPTKPTRIAKPVKPNEPKLATYKYHRNFIEKFLPIVFDSKIKSIETEYNLKLQEKYDLSMEKYEQKMIQYAKDTYNYAHYLVPKESVEWHSYDSAINYRLYVLNKYLDNYYRYLSERYLKQAVTKMLDRKVYINSTFILKYDISKSITPLLKKIDINNLINKTVGKENISERIRNSFDQVAYNCRVPGFDFKFNNYSSFEYNPLYSFERIYVKEIEEKDIHGLAEAYNNQIILASEKAGYINNASVNNYIFNTSNLGWANCDKFYDNQDQRMLITMKAAPNTSIIIYCKSIQSCLSPYFDGKNYTISIPKNIKIDIVAFQTRNGQLAYTTASNTVSNNILFDFNNKFQIGNLKTIQSIMTKMVSS